MGAGRARRPNLSDQMRTLPMASSLRNHPFGSCPAQAPHSDKLPYRGDKLGSSQNRRLERQHWQDGWILTAVVTPGSWTTASNIPAWKPYQLARCHTESHRPAAGMSSSASSDRLPPFRTSRKHIRQNPAAFTFTASSQRLESLLQIIPNVLMITCTKPKHPYRGSHELAAEAYTEVVRLHTDRRRAARRR
jgi:hypothetical protein